MLETTGRIDVHSHLLPGVDDGCQTLEESVECARRLVDAGYTHSFCTPHIWPSLPRNTVQTIRERTLRMEGFLREAGVDLKLMPGGEINLRDDTPSTPSDQLVTYAMNARYCLIDLWADRLPAFFLRGVQWFQSLGISVILAHPERMRAVQEAPALADKFAEWGVLLQGNLQCFSDAPESATRRVAEKYLAEGRYFMLGTDLHNIATLGLRLDGLHRAMEIAGEKAVMTLTRDNPSKLLPVAPPAV